MRSIKDFFSKGIISVVGCNGKTTFIKSLAEDLNDGENSILISTTTKIRPIVSDSVSTALTLEEITAHKAVKGIQCLGILDAVTGKMSGLPYKMLEEKSSEYDYVLLEADGSRGLPYKGWLDSEPVVPQITTATVGIVTLAALNRVVDDSTVFRIPEFTELTGLNRGDEIDYTSIATMLCGNGGMFKNAVGKKCLFISHVEDDEKKIQALELIKNINENYYNFFDLIAYGSSIDNSWIEVSI